MGGGLRGATGRSAPGTLALGVPSWCGGDLKAAAAGSPRHLSAQTRGPPAGLTLQAAWTFGVPTDCDPGAPPPAAPTPPGRAVPAASQGRAAGKGTLERCRSEAPSGGHSHRALERQGSKYQHQSTFLLLRGQLPRWVGSNPRGVVSPHGETSGAVFMSPAALHHHLTLCCCSEVVNDGAAGSPAREGEASSRRPHRGCHGLWREAACPEPASGTAGHLK